MTPKMQVNVRVGEKSGKKLQELASKTHRSKNIIATFYIEYGLYRAGLLELDPAEVKVIEDISQFEKLQT